MSRAGETGMLGRLGRVQTLAGGRLDALSAVLPERTRQMPFETYLAQAAQVRDPQFQAELQRALAQYQTVGGRYGTEQS